MVKVIIFMLVFYFKINFAKKLKGANKKARKKKSRKQPERIYEMVMLLSIRFFAVVCFVM